MIAPKILALGKFSAQDVQIIFAPSNRKTNDHIEAQLDVAWQQMQAQARAEGRQLYNGTSYRLNSLHQDAQNLALELATFEYKTRDGLLRVPGYFDLAEAYYRKGCYTGATVKTADNKYLMVKLSGKSMNINATDMLGGIVDAVPPIATGGDLFNALYKELHEEALITKNDIENCYLRAVFLDHKTNVGFYFEVTLKVTAAEIAAKAKSAALDSEIDAVQAFTKAEYLAALQAHSKSKQLIASIVASPSKMRMGFAPELLQSIYDNRKLTTYRFGQKYDYLQIGDIIECQNSATNEVVGKLRITGKKAVTFEQLPLESPTHETYKNKDHQRQVLSSYYPHIGRQIKDDDLFLVFDFEVVGDNDQAAG